uniref:Regulator of chromosome condensation protein n=1 Tax=Pithovirus LCPAC401 TaxID=2506595 RepID=A0A481ZBK1_9VIRU|nr:MAG: hypothetical protein LCPAC401_04830 [Pithovirus LCPAC401]
MDLESRIIADCGNLSLDISDLICKFLILKPINKHIAYNDFTSYIIKNGKIIITSYNQVDIYRGKGIISYKQDFISISVNYFNSVALCSDGTFKLWRQHLTMKYYTPDESDFVSVTAVNDDVIAIRSDGSVKSMKKGEMKKKGFVMFTGSMSNYCMSIIGLKSDGTIDFLEIDSHTEYLPKGSDYISVATGYLHILALKIDGTICTTRPITDSFGLISNTPKEDNFIAIAARRGNSVALTDNGVICIWGKGYDEMKTIPAKDCIDIIMSDEKIIGLTSNGDVVKYPLPAGSLMI